MSGNKQASEGIAPYFTFPPEPRNGQRVTSTFGITYEFRVNAQGRSGWYEAGTSAVSNYIFGIGLTENPPGTVNLDPATPAPGEIGGLNEPPANGIQHTRSYAAGVGTWSPVAAGGLTFDTGLTLTGTSVALDAATPAPGEIGGINEPPADGQQYTRSYTGGAGAWNVVAAGGLVFDTGLTLTGTSVTLDPALPPGGEIGGINEPPADTGFQYTRSYTAGVGSWTQTSAAGYTWGIGLVENPVGSLNIDLLPATALELGGVTVQPRTVTQGLALDVAGDISVPLATDLLAGSIVEPAPDGLAYARTRNLAGVSSWAVTTAVFVGDAPPLPPLSQGQLWFESDTGRLHLYYVDATSGQWVQVGGA